MFSPDSGCSYLRSLSYMHTLEINWSKLELVSPLGFKVSVFLYIRKIHTFTPLPPYSTITVISTMLQQYQKSTKAVPRAYLE